MTAPDNSPPPECLPYGYYHVRVDNLWAVAHWGQRGWTVAGLADVIAPAQITEIGPAVPPRTATIASDKVGTARNLISEIAQLDEMLRVPDENLRLVADFGMRTLKLPLSPVSLRGQIAPALRAYLQQRRAEQVTDLLALFTSGNEEVPPR